ncbi:anthranilate synthase component II [Staphylococcus edaphicus]|uniref:Aminodeoxychorismate/anthranilate synthase component II n=1 Tax=Staphylococcus edaphicus TaxID=1955013 RepID=A0A2C6WRF9_9STAP|nr:aminodeoxychorismate/anthranilate synthase component II [Staphylococcus edaphicus]PHK50384.1 aminodeoxychorismate/anthranilate synthase component II [Staphylococcus edaphicus]UQW81068.1 aminodeoxychorismate/anthranilate synthase component II [Staphylococcus edaphicus]
MILMIDNKDSFTYNIVDYLKQSYVGTIEVIDVEYLTVSKIYDLAPKAIVISPGPGAPSDYPILNEVIRMFSKHIPILGICLGFQQIVTYFGGDIIKSDKPIHGHTTQIKHNNKGIFHQLPDTFKVMRYHSLIAKAQSFPDSLEITALNDAHIIMGLEHKSLPIYGLQYHPESILSEHGLTQIFSFIKIVEAYHANTL